MTRVKPRDVAKALFNAGQSVPAIAQQLGPRYSESDVRSLLRAAGAYRRVGQTATAFAGDPTRADAGLRRF